MGERSCMDMTFEITEELKEKETWQTNDVSSSNKKDWSLIYFTIIIDEFIIQFTGKGQTDRWMEKKLSCMQLKDACKNMKDKRT